MIKQAIFILWFLFFAALTDAAVWENIPAFPQAQKVKQEDTLVNNKQIQTTIYTTAASPQEVVAFYRAKLSSFGWKLESEIAQQGINMLVLSKEDKYLNVMVQNIMGKNFLTITQSILSKEPPPKEEKSCPECEKQSEELRKKLKLTSESILEDAQIAKEFSPQIDVSSEEDTPGKDLQFVPRYPGAVRVNDIERENGKKVSLTYYSRDSVEAVVDFYRRNMGNYYWNPGDEVDFSDIPEELSEKIKVDIKGKSLVFKSATASCIISITEESQNKGTIIGVNYNEK